MFRGLGVRLWLTMWAAWLGASIAPRWYSRRAIRRAYQFAVHSAADWMDRGDEARAREQLAHADRYWTKLEALR